MGKAPPEVGSQARKTPNEPRDKTSGGEIMRLLLIGDIHSYRLLVPPWALLGKRLLGQGNVWLNRRHKFDRTLLPALVQQAASVEPDMVLLCGDLTSTALPGEFDDCLKALAPLVDAFPVMIVPGNHDRYTFTSARRSLLESAAGTSIPPEFPHCHRYPSPFNRWRLLALDAARPRGLSSRGEVGKAQLAEARRQIADLTDSDEYHLSVKVA